MIIVNIWLRSSSILVIIFFEDNNNNDKVRLVIELSERLVFDDEYESDSEFIVDVLDDVFSSKNNYRKYDIKNNKEVTGISILNIV
jgi:hypothetical protein